MESNITNFILFCAAVIVGGILFIALFPVILAVLSFLIAAGFALGILYIFVWIAKKLLGWD